MFGSRTDREMVTCIACGERLSRSDAREYDKHGDRWDRRDKTFEYVCKACFGEMSRHPRGDLEATLDAAGAGETDRETFLEQFRELSRSESE
ncbi:hypothetical protein KTS45_07250 [Halomicroarcula limicola]|uniref:Small CPxCG-related zinc finger protein n=1 Tax=Haloarcula limicola TaxID=1429915 RepID=A0A8J8C6J0_9EURY|nr:hypothetical protein [Halomicroarcula limicola]MBV0923998.1 hypothetical protein [Halomicroarcula limicola]